MTDSSAYTVYYLRSFSPLIGGAFAEPAAQFPGWLDIPFFRKYPYILPCIVANILCIAAALLSIFYLREVSPFPNRFQYLLLMFAM